MVSFVWKTWLRRASDALTSRGRRKLKTTQFSQLENLELRTLLTANLPVAVEDSYTTAEDTQLTGVTVLANDTDADSDTIDQAVLDTNVQNGTLVLNSDGTFLYTPSPNFHGTDSFTYFARDSANSEQSATSVTVTITVTPVNDAPSGIASTFVTDEDEPIEDQLTAVDVDSPNITYHLGNVAPFNGTVTINPDGSFLYTPNENFNGSDLFSFYATDGDAQGTDTTISITIHAVNDQPVALADSFEVDEEAQLIDSLSGTDVENSELTYTAGTTAPQHGTVTINPDGTFTYTPHTDYFGEDTFSFTVSDGSLTSNEATVLVTVAPTQDAPVATPGAYTIDEDEILEGTVSGTDIDEEPLTYVVGSTAPSFGVLSLNPDGTFIYTPNPNAHGVDSFTFQAYDGQTYSADAIITITINSLNDAPTGSDESFNGTEDSPVTDTLNVVDAESDPLTFHVASQPQHGTVTINNDGTFEYTPTQDYAGTDQFTYYANDGTVDSATYTVTITLAPLNDLPIASDMNVSTHSNTALTGVLTASDVDLDTLDFSAGATQPQSGTVVILQDGSYTYTPDTDFTGTDTFSFLVNDGTGNSNEATVTVTVIANAVPVADPQSFTTEEDTPYTGQLAGSDADEDPLTYLVGTAPAHGTVEIAEDGSFVYTPATDYFGTDSFTFHVNDGVGNSIAAQVDIIVTAVNDAPVADNLEFTVDEDDSLTETLTGTDGDLDTVTFEQGDDGPDHGTVVINPDGTFTYTPNADFFGTDSFTYRISDGTATSTEAVVTLTVAGIDDAPTVIDGAGTVTEDGVLDGSVSPLGLDVDGDPLTFTLVDQPTHGTLTLSPDGTFVYTPDPDYNGFDSFTFRASDGTTETTVATFNITVTAADEPLVLNSPGGPVDAQRKGARVPLDPNATVSDADSPIVYANAEIRATVGAGNTAGDIKHNRFTLAVLNQGKGPGLIQVKGSKIYFDGSRTPIATFTGGKKGRALVITFTSAADEQAFTAVLQLVSAHASKKASVGARTINLEVRAGDDVAQVTKTVNVV